MDRPEAELVRQCLAGEHGAWESIVHQHHQRIYNLAYRQRPAPVRGATAARPPLPPPLPPAPKPASARPSPGPADPVETSATRQSAGYSGGGSDASKPADKAESEPKDDEGSSSSGSGKED